MNTLAARHLLVKPGLGIFACNECERQGWWQQALVDMAGKFTDYSALATITDDAGENDRDGC